jgi:hypothetical protein
MTRIDHMAVIEGETQHRFQGVIELCHFHYNRNGNFRGLMLTFLRLGTMVCTRITSLVET